MSRILLVLAILGGSLSTNSSSCEEGQSSSLVLADECELLQVSSRFEERKPVAVGQPAVAKRTREPSQGNNSSAEAAAGNSVTAAERTSTAKSLAAGKLHSAAERNSTGKLLAFDKSDSAAERNSTATLLVATASQDHFKVHSNTSLVDYGCCSGGLARKQVGVSAEDKAKCNKDESFKNGVYLSDTCCFQHDKDLGKCCKKSFQKKGKKKVKKCLAKADNAFYSCVQEKGAAGACKEAGFFSRSVCLAMAQGILTAFKGEAVNTKCE
mmetsp:Transcript_87566/g.154991  ORF Transcript_87566/g.154991 Transcript_87566/m.154991 type:complete len:268 (-) Transcript_87566:110-913(-)